MEGPAGWEGYPPAIRSHSFSCHPENHSGHFQQLTLWLQTVATGLHTGSGVTSTELIRFRCTAEEKARWSKQAGARTLSDYFKFLADRDGGVTVNPAHLKGKSNYVPDWKPTAKPKKTR